MGFRIGSLTSITPSCWPHGRGHGSPFSQDLQADGGRPGRERDGQRPWAGARGPNSRRLLASDGSDRPLSVQIFGADAEIMARAALICQEEGASGGRKYGLPCNQGGAKRRRGGPSARPPQAARMLDAIRKAIRIPLTVKLRAGWTAQDFVAPEVARIARNAVSTPSHFIPEPVPRDTGSRPAGT